MLQKWGPEKLLTLKLLDIIRHNFHATDQEMCTAEGCGKEEVRIPQFINGFSFLSALEFLVKPKLLIT